MVDSCSPHEVARPYPQAKTQPLRTGDGVGDETGSTVGDGVGGGTGSSHISVDSVEVGGDIVVVL